MYPLNEASFPFFLHGIGEQVSLLVWFEYCILKVLAVHVIDVIWLAHASNIVFTEGNWTHSKP